MIAQSVVKPVTVDNLTC